MSRTRFKTSMPPGVANLELHAGIHAGVTVPQRGTRNMNRIGGKVNGAPRIYEIVKPHSELRREVKHAGAARRAMLNHYIRRKLVRRINQPARSLKPGREMPPGRKIPTQNNRCDAEARIGAA